MGGQSTTALDPIIGDGRVTNVKISPGAVNTLKGTNTVPSVVDVILGDGLTMEGNTLKVSTTTIGGPFLPLSGGIITGNVIISPPFKISQSTAPTNGEDLINKTFANISYQAKQSSVVPMEVAIFGTGLNIGQTVGSGFTIDTNLSNPPSNTTLWPSSRITNTLQYGAVMYKSTSPIPILSLSSVKAFSLGSSYVGPNIWPNSETIFNINNDGIITISNSFSYTTYFKVMFYADSLNETTVDTAVVCSFKKNLTNTEFGIPKTLKAYHPTGHTNQIIAAAFISVDGNQSFDFYVNLNNISAETVIVDFNNSFSYITIDRVA